MQVGSDAAVFAMLASNRSRQTRYRVYTNARNKYYNYGGALGLIFSLPENYTLSGNLSYNNISENKQRDVFVTGFNTPKWITNLSLRNREFIKIPDLISSGNGRILLIGKARLQMAELQHSVPLIYNSHTSCPI